MTTQQTHKQTIEAHWLRRKEVADVNDVYLQNRLEAEKVELRLFK